LFGHYGVWPLYFTIPCSLCIKIGENFFCKNNPLLYRFVINSSFLSIKFSKFRSLDPLMLLQSSSKIRNNLSNTVKSSSGFLTSNNLFASKDPTRCSKDTLVFNNIHQDLRSISNRTIGCITKIEHRKPKNIRSNRSNAYKPRSTNRSNKI
jgi:hypothetical protein